MTKFLSHTHMIIMKVKPLCGANLTHHGELHLTNENLNYKQMKLYKKNIIFLLLMLFFPFIALSQNNEKEMLAAQYYSDGEYEKAVVLYEELYNEKRSNINYNNYLDCLLKLEDYNTAKKMVKKAVKYNPGNQKYRVDQGYVYEKEGKKSKAVKEYDDAIKEAPLRKNEIIELANAFEHRGKINFAIETYKTGQKKLKSPTLFTFELADLYEAKKDYESMMQTYVEYLENPVANYNELQGILQRKLKDDPKNKKHETLRYQLLKKTQKDPGNTAFSEMLLWLSIQQKDFDMAFIQARALDKRNDEDGLRLLKLAQICKDHKNYDIAIDCYEYVMGKGEEKAYFIRAWVGLLNASYLKVTQSLNYTQKDLEKIEKRYTSAIEELGKSRATVPLLTDLAHIQAFYLDKTGNAINILKEILGMPALPAKVKAHPKLELADIYLVSGEPWEATLLYSQVEKDFKHEPIGHLAKFKNAKFSFYMGEFQWAKAQLDVLKAATSKLIANDAMDLSLLIKENIGEDSSEVPLKKYASADLLFYRNKNMQAIQILDSVKTLFPNHPIIDNALFKKAKIYLSMNQFAKADSVLAIIVEEHSQGLLADDALFTRARLYDEEFKNTEKARELYKQILLSYPASVYTIKSRKRFRELRGDFAN